MEIEEIKRQIGNKNNTAPVNSMPIKDREINGCCENVGHVSALSGNEAKAMERAIR